MVQDGDTKCSQRLHNGKPDNKSGCSTWNDHTTVDLQLALIDSSHIQATSGRWFNGDKKNLAFVKSLE